MIYLDFNPAIHNPPELNYESIQKKLLVLTGVTFKQRENSLAIFFESNDTQYITQLSLRLKMLKIINCRDYNSSVEQIFILSENFQHIETLFRKDNLDFEKLGQIFPQIKPNERILSLRKELKFQAAQHQLFFLIQYSFKKYEEKHYLCGSFSSQSAQESISKLLTEYSITHHCETKKNFDIIISEESFPEIAREFFKKFKISPCADPQKEENFETIQKQLFFLTLSESEKSLIDIPGFVKGYHLRIKRTYSLERFFRENNIAHPKPKKSNFYIIKPEELSKISELYFKSFPFLKETTITPELAISTQTTGRSPLVTSPIPRRYTPNFNNLIANPSSESITSSLETPFSHLRLTY